MDYEQCEQLEAAVVEAMVKWQQYAHGGSIRKCEATFCLDIARKWVEVEYESGKRENRLLCMEHYVDHVVEAANWTSFIITNEKDIS